MNTDSIKMPLHKTYCIVDTQTGERIGNYTDRKRASRKADRLDLQYGAIRYRVELIEK